MSLSAEQREQLWAQSNREELVERIARALPEDGVRDIFPGFRIVRSSDPSEPIHSVYQPAFCYIAQGSKQALLNDEVFRYDPGNYLIYTVDLPLTFRVVEASKDRPYLGFRLNLDPSLVASVVMEAAPERRKGDASIKAIAVSPTDPNMLDAVVRLVRLIDSPSESAVFAMPIMREIVFRLLAGGQGARLGHLLASGGNTHRIAKAIERLRNNLDQPLKIENFASDLGMSVSGFHHHFKSVTAMSPLQFQKNLRMQEARRLMLAEDLDAASAAFRVGYEDPSYFGRDYKKQFGAPPQRDIACLRENM